MKEGVTMMMMQHEATHPFAIHASIAVREHENNHDAVLSMKPAAEVLLRTRDSRDMLHAYLSALKRARCALQLVSPKDTPQAQIPLLRIAVNAIGIELNAAKTALLGSEESLRQAYEFMSLLTTQSLLARAAALVIEDYERERATTLNLMTEIRELCQPYQNILQKV
jgi:hypothetical protein